MPTHALLFTDVVDSTARVAALGDAAAASLWADHDRAARELLARHGGREIDRSDGFFLLFDDMDDAAAFAMGYHAALAPLGLSARVGLHVGEVAMRANPAEAVARGAKPLEVDGLAKPLAARVMSLTRGGRTLLSAEAAAALGERVPAGGTLRSHGHWRLKGIAEPVEVHELAADGSTAEPPPDGDKAYRVVRDGGLWLPRREIRHNLAPERDAFVGRVGELAELARRLDDGERLVTVLGVGGTGKARLVRRYGRAWLGEWPGGVHFCDLSEARSLEGICYAVASALDVPLGKDDPVVQLGHAIGGRGRCLVILDNFEQVVEHAAATLGRWLDRADAVSFVVTSRERVQLPGESVLAVEPLRVDDEGVELFDVRARAQRPGYAPDPASRAAVGEIVRLLDGLPLAIELAAARVRVLSPPQILQRLADRFVLLAGARGAAARQATLKAAIDWSWELLQPWEQSALAQCSVFEGGFTLEAAEAVLDLSEWTEAPPVLDVVQSLVDKSLLRVMSPGTGTRLDLADLYFGMYLSIRDYAAGKLLASGQPSTTEYRHGRYFARHGLDDAIEALSRHGGDAPRRLLAFEIENLVAACRRACATANAEVAVATYRAAWEVLDARGPVRLGADLGAEVQALDSMAAPLRARTSWTRGKALQRAGRPSEAVPFLESALSLARSIGDRFIEAECLGCLGNCMSDLGRLDEARRHLEDAVSLAAETDLRCSEGKWLANLGSVHHMQGAVEVGRDCRIAALAIHREVGDRVLEGLALGNVAVLHREQGRFDEALPAFEQALTVHREVGSLRGEALVRANLGVLHLDQGEFDLARTQLEASLKIWRELGDRFSEGIALGNLACVNRDQGQTAAAEGQFETSISIACEVGNRRHEAFLWGALGELREAQGRLIEALEHCEQGLSISRAVGSRRGEASLTAQIAGLLLDLGRDDEGLMALRDGAEMLREVGDTLGLAKLRCREGAAHAKRSLS